ncbi:hypothetical protein K3495_g11465 [Podosphaera aphanis]|nr:hypothetical protein K3495_g11465 [Podosphaera aphanis]
MARSKEEKNKIKLARPTQYQPDPSHETLLELAAKRQLLKAQDKASDSDALVGRTGDAVLWSTSLTMLHFTLDVLVTHQYAVEIIWLEILQRAVQAFPGEFCLRRDEGI